MYATKKLRIFISSPGDVAEERKIACDLIRTDLQKTFNLRNENVALEPISWDDPVSNIVMLANESPHKSVVEHLALPGDCDVVVVILRLRMGTPLPANIRKKNGDPYHSGTEWEYIHALESPSKPPILLYFRNDRFVIDSTEASDAELRKEKLEQYTRVQEFKDQFKSDDGSLTGAYNIYDTVQEFKHKLSNDLHVVLFKLLNPHNSTSRPILTGRTKYLKACYKEWRHLDLSILGQEHGRLHGVKLDEVFISLQVTPRNHEPLTEDHPNPQVERQAPLPAVEVLNKHKKIVLLGDPGSGKSSLVKHILADLAKSELEKRSLLIPEARGLLPVFISLRELVPALFKAEDDLPDKISGARQRQKVLANLVVDRSIHTMGFNEDTEIYNLVHQAFQDQNVFLVLDGLDEVPSKLQELARETASAIVNEYELPRVIVTCRIRSYTGDNVFKNVQTFTLASLSNELIISFIEKWYTAHFSSGNTEEIQQRIDDLTRMAISKPLLPLSQNPMLLTTMSIIHQSEASLSGERVRLYAKAVDILLRGWQQIKAPISPGLFDFLQNHEDRILLCMKRLAFEAHRTSTSEDKSNLSRGEIIDLLYEERILDDNINPLEFLNYIDLRSGLLISRGGASEGQKEYSFPHRTIQEYLAGCYIFEKKGVPKRLLDLAQEGNYWSEAIHAGIEEHILNQGEEGQHRVLDIASKITMNAPKTEEESRRILWAGKMAEVLGPVTLTEMQGDLESGKETLNRLKGQLVNMLYDSLPPVERAEAGRILGHLGDPRRELLTLEEMTFCYVPPGAFLMGKESREIELPYGYWMGQYPVTNAQFQLFISSGAYSQKQWWTKAGWEFLASREQQTLSQLGLENYPVVNISWHEALAFTRWITAECRNRNVITSQHCIALPSEPEWEKAARGGLNIPARPVISSLADIKPPAFNAITNEVPDRPFPWGTEPITTACNNSDSLTGEPSTPGCFESGASPYGIHDLCGNVWEWSRSKGIREGYTNDISTWAQRESISGKEQRMMRGGAFFRPLFDIGCTKRQRLLPTYTRYSDGFRMVVLPLNREEEDERVIHYLNLVYAE